MSTWSGIRHKLETEYLAPSLRGHIQYFATSYSKSPDHEGRAAIRYNGKEIINTALELGVFDQRCFYQAFDEFDNQNIDKSLSSDNLIIRIFAILDRRVGKRKLISMRNFMEEQPPVFQEFYAIRVYHEGL